MAQFPRGLAGISDILQSVTDTGLSLVISRLRVVKANTQDHSCYGQESSSLAVIWGPPLFSVSTLAH